MKRISAWPTGRRFGPGQIARLKAAGATDKQIGQARSDSSKTHSGVLETEYLAGIRGAFQ